MKLFVAGGTGFVGRDFVRRAVAAEHQVRCLFRDAVRVETMFGSGIELVRGDILDLDSLRKGIQGVEAAVNFVGITYEQEETSFKDIYVKGVENLITVLKEFGVRRYLHMSVLGAEERSTSRYFKAKWEADELVRRSGLDYTIFKPSVIFGPEDNLINRYVKMVRWLPIVPVIGRGKTKVQPVFVGDVSRAFLEALKRPVSIGKEYLLGGPEVMTSTQIINTVMFLYRKKRLKVRIPRALLFILGFFMEKLLPNPFITREELRVLRHDSVCDISDFRRELGIEPVSLKKNLRNYIEI